MLHQNRFNNICVVVILIVLSSGKKEHIADCVDTQQTPPQPQTNITLTITTLSQARSGPAATSLNELVFFGGGVNATGESDRVDIYNVTSGSWTTATLSIARHELAATSSGNLVFFGGGWNQTGGTTPYNQVDIYNISDNSWSTATLSQARAGLAATSVGNVILFAGGYNSNTTFNPAYFSNVVDIYNVTSGTWSSATLSQGRWYLAATTVANRYALFAGGYNGSNYSNVVDIFDSLNEKWETATLSQSRAYLAATSLGNLAFFGGGQSFNNQLSYVVDIFNSTTQMWSTATLSQARYGLAAASAGDIVAFGGGNGSSTPLSVVDVFNVTAGVWFTLTLSVGLFCLAATSSKNKLFFGGGNDTSGYSDVVDIFDVPSPPQSSTTTMTTITPSTNSTSPLSSTPSLLSSTISTLQITSTNVNSPQKFPSTLQTSGLSIEEIVGIVVGIVALLIGVGLILFLILFIKRKRNQKFKNNTEQNESFAMKPQNQNYSMRPQNQETITIESLEQNIVNNNNTITTVQNLHPPETKAVTLKGVPPCEISINELVIGKEIGRGNYGRVCVGKWKKYRVALKFCQNKGMMDEFMKETNLLISLPPHPNVVRMYGVSIDGTQPIIVMEYCGGGLMSRYTHNRIHMHTRWWKFGQVVV
jgi:hypothetical protein